MKIIYSKINSGLTLTELMITIVISGILFLFIGRLFYDTHRFRIRQTSKVEIERDIQTARFRIENELRKAKEIRIDENNQNTLNFITFEVDGSTVSKTLSLNQGDLVLTNNNRSNSPSELILAGVRNIRFEYLPGTIITTSTVIISIEAEKAAGYLSNGSTDYIVSFSTFVVKGRNISQRYRVE